MRHIDYMVLPNGDAVQLAPISEKHFVPVPRAGPFPTLACREMVKNIVAAIDAAIVRSKLTDEMAYWFALGNIRGARKVARLEGDATRERFAVELLEIFSHRGVPAVRELIEQVNGKGLTEISAGD